MIRISALGSTASSDDEDASRSLPVHQVRTKEAQEAESLNLYNKALLALKQSDTTEAESLFHRLLQLPPIAQIDVSCLSQDGKATPQSDDGDPGDNIVNPLLVLKYNSYKNLASLAANEEKNDKAMEYYLEAVTVDSTDVTVWYRIGVLARKIHNYPLARHAFEQGLQINATHWPCLDQVITVLYALSNYQVCLHYISVALGRDPGYVKGLSLMRQIYKEAPYMVKDTQKMFINCEESIHTIELQDDEIEEYVKEAEDIRRKRRELNKPVPNPVVQFSKPFNQLTWKCLGDCLVSTYDWVVEKMNTQTSDQTKPRYNLGCKLDLTLPGDKPQETDKPETDKAPKTDKPPDTSEPAPMETDPPPESSVPPSQTTSDSSNPPTQTSEGEDESTETDKEEKTTSSFQTMRRMPPSLAVAKKKKGFKYNYGDYEKRRSSRVRNPYKKKEEVIKVDYEDAIRKFFPDSLLRMNEDENAPEDDTADPTPSSYNEENSDTPAQSTSNPLGFSQNEEEEVKKFIECHVNNNDVIDILNEYLIAVASKVYLKWPVGLTDTFVEAYDRLRQHIMYPDFLCKDEDDERISDMAQLCLVLTELKVDRWLNNKAKMAALPSPAKSPAPGNSVLGPDFPGTFFLEDLNYLVAMTTFHDILNNSWIDFCIRVFWARARFYSLDNKMDMSVDSFERTTEYVQYAQTEKKIEKYSVKLPNSSVDKDITIDGVSKQLENLQRCQSLEEVHRLHERGNHGKVIELLKQTFSQSQNKVVEVGERRAQLILLLESYTKLKDHKNCLLWGEISFNEAFQRFQGASSKTKDDWAETLKELASGIHKSLQQDLNIARSLPSKNRIRLVQNLTKLESMSLQASNSDEEMAKLSVFPWILLYWFIRYEERRQVEEDLDADLDSEAPSSLMLLSAAHEYLGRKSWCLVNDGELPFFIISILMKELKEYSPDDPHPHKEDVDLALGQCFYCLYGHPTKKSKARLLNDHNVTQLDLTWERCGDLFDFFKPTSMPEYDSYRTSAVSAELENLLRRISLLIPQEQSAGVTIDELTSFIEGTIDVAPSLEKEVPADMAVTQELYYLLADYYFKNKEQGKAIKFYLNDLCVNPTRFDSWAGMALARAARLEAKLNSTSAIIELKNEPCTIQKQSVSALRCFKRALELDSSNSKLWIEYGGLSYQLHANASRQLKQLHIFPLNDELIQKSRTNRVEMLELAEKCYVAAGQCDGEEGSDEPWLQHYMLGKIAEKLGKNPVDYLEHYKLASNHTHEDSAKYPKKITYMYTAPHLAVESLEIFFRLHVSIMKYLNKNYKKFKQLEKDQPESDKEPSKVSEAKETGKTEVVEVKSEIKDKCDEVQSGQDAIVKTPQSEKDDKNKDENEEIKDEPMEVQGTKANEEKAGVLEIDAADKSENKLESEAKEEIGKPEIAQKADDTDTGVKKMETGTVMEVDGENVKSSDKNDDEIENGNNERKDVSPKERENVDKTDENTNKEKPEDNTSKLKDGENKTGPNEDKNIHKVKANEKNANETTPDKSKKGIKSAEENLEKLLDDLEKFVKEAAESPFALAQEKDRVRKQADKEENPQSSASQKQKPSADHTYSRVKSSSESGEQSQESMDRSYSMSSPTPGIMATPPLSSPPIRSPGVAPPNLFTRQGSSPNVSGFSVSTPVPSRPTFVSSPISSSFSMDNILGKDPESKTKRTESFGFAPSSVDPSKESQMEVHTPETQSGGNVDEKMITDNQDTKKIDADSTAQSVALVGSSQEVSKPEGTASTKSSADEPGSTTDDSSAKIAQCTADNLKADEKEVDPKSSQSCSVDSKSDQSVDSNSKTEQTNPSGTTSIQSDPNNTKADQSDPPNTKSNESDASNTKSDQSEPSTSKSDLNKTKTDQAIIIQESKFEPPKPRTIMDKYRCIMGYCMKGLTLCLIRFPQHYKSLYRLAYTYFCHPLFKNCEHAKDLLLGMTEWQDHAHMPCPGLFQERKHANFFNGLWRIPTEEIDRSGSFASHITRALLLLYKVLSEMKDYKMFYVLHAQLSKTPEQGKKYLRDPERVYLAQQAFELCLQAFDDSVDASKKEGEEKRKKFLLDAYRVWQHGLRQGVLVTPANNMFANVFKSCFSEKVESDTALVDQAVKFCTQLNTAKTPTTPSTTSKPIGSAERPTEGDQGQTDKGQGHFDSATPNSSTPSTHKSSPDNIMISSGEDSPDKAQRTPKPIDLSISKRTPISSEVMQKMKSSPQGIKPISKDKIDKPIELGPPPAKVAKISEVASKTSPPKQNVLPATFAAKFAAMSSAEDIRKMSERIVSNVLNEKKARESNVQGEKRVRESSESSDDVIMLDETPPKRKEKGNVAQQGQDKIRPALMSLLASSSTEKSRNISSTALLQSMKASESSKPKPSSTQPPKKPVRVLSGMLTGRSSPTQKSKPMPAALKPSSLLKPSAKSAISVPQSKQNRPGSSAGGMSSSAVKNIVESSGIIDKIIEEELRASTSSAQKALREESSDSSDCCIVLSGSDDSLD